MMKFILMMGMLSINYGSELMFYFNSCFFLSFLLLFIFSFKFMSNSMIGGYMGVDLYGYSLMMLSIWIIGLMMMSILKEKNNNLKIFLFMSMLMILILGFLSKSLMIFYFFFEISLVPTFIMVIYLGNNPERTEAGFYMLMYTLFISLPLLIYLFQMYIKLGSLEFIISGHYFCGNIEVNSVGKYLMILMAFLIKMPMYLFHIWLPKAHVEAPVYGSMLLAGVLLKLGSYGLLRMLMILKMMKYNYFLFFIGLMGGLLVSIFCLVQIDMKMLVAYSSVVHMNMMMSAMMTMSKVGFVGAYILMVAHGLCSSCMFYMVNFFYKRTGSRLLMFNKGMVNVMPSVMLVWLIVCVMNFSFPFSLNFISEILMMMSIVSWDFKMFFILMLMSFFSSAYSLYLFSFVFHGEIFVVNKFSSGEIAEYLVMLFHLIPLLMLLLNLDLF